MSKMGQVFLFHPGLAILFAPFAVGEGPTPNNRLAPLKVKVKVVVRLFLEPGKNGLFCMKNRLVKSIFFGREKKPKRIGRFEVRGFSVLRNSLHHLASHDMKPSLKK